MFREQTAEEQIITMAVAKAELSTCGSSTPDDGAKGKII
jgi:hypothetical protein